MGRIRLSLEAEADLDGIWWYAAGTERNADQAERYLRRFYSFFELLAANLYLGRARPDVKPGFRSFAIAVFVVFYKVENGEALIVRVVHGHRDIPALFEL